MKWLMLFKEITVIYSEKHKCMLWAKLRASLMLQHVVQIVTTVLWVFMEVRNDKIYGEILLKHFQGSDRDIFVSEDSKFKLF
jgi:hypothetical protein